MHCQARHLSVVTAVLSGLLHGLEAPFRGPPWEEELDGLEALYLGI